MSQKIKVYIAGPVSNSPETQRPFFHLMATRLEKAGFLVLYTGRLPIGLSEPDYMKVAHSMLEICDVVLMLDGWDKSDGANAEYHWAKKLERQVILPEEVNEFILDGPQEARTSLMKHRVRIMAPHFIEPEENVVRVI